MPTTSSPRPAAVKIGVALQQLPVSVPAPSGNFALALLWSALGAVVSTVLLTNVPGELLSERLTATQLAEAFAPPAAKFSPITDLKVPANLPTLVGADPI